MVSANLLPSGLTRSVIDAITRKPQEWCGKPIDEWNVYVYDPKPDITALELATLLKNINFLRGSIHIHDDQIKDLGTEFRHLTFKHKGVDPEYL